jgi:hypothetical protein
MKYIIYIILILVLTAFAGPIEKKTTVKQDTLEVKTKGSVARQSATLESSTPAPSVAGASEADLDESSYKSEIAVEPPAKPAEPEHKEITKPKNDIIGALFKAFKESVEEENSDYDVFKDANKNGIDDKFEKKTTESKKSTTDSSEPKIKSSKKKTK